MNFPSLPLFTRLSFAFPLPFPVFSLPRSRSVRTRDESSSGLVIKGIGFIDGYISRRTRERERAHSYIGIERCVHRSMERKMRIRMRSAEVMGGNTRNWLISADDWRSQNHRCVIIRWLFFLFFFFFFKQEERNDGKQHVALVERRCPRRGIQEADHSEERERREGGACYLSLWTSSTPFDQRKKKFSRNELTALLLPALW